MNWFDFYGCPKYTLANMVTVGIRAKLEWIIKQLNAFRTDLLIDISKILLYALAQLIWYLMFIFHLEDHNFQPPDVSSFFSKFPKSMMILKLQKRVKLAQKASCNAG